MQPPKIWREKRQRYLGLGIECTECSSKTFPFSQQCPKCSSMNVKEYKISNSGKLIHFAQVSQTAKEMMANVPYVIGIVELDDGIRVTGQITDTNYSELKEGMRVRMVLRILAKDGEQGLIRYGFKFVPAD